MKPRRGAESVVELTPPGAAAPRPMLDAAWSMLDSLSMVAVARRKQSKGEDKMKERLR